MLLIRLLPAARSDRSSDKTKCRRGSWKQQALRAVLNWLMEPIEFPGKIYHLDPDFANRKKH